VVLAPPPLHTLPIAALPGWSRNTKGCATFEDLPGAAQAYVRRIEQLMGIPITWVGIGASRASMLTTF
jgi:adenylosuccinate synthase